jgi:transcriptional regulator with XRE-family HTH domain
MIKDAREYKKLTRAELADFVGLSEKMIGEIENNTTLPDFDTAFLIVQFLGIDVDLGWLRIITESGLDVLPIEKIEYYRIYYRQE